MQYNLMFPMRAVKHWRSWSEGVSIGDVARIVETAGFSGFAMSEHPYPDKKWLSNGGHHAFDPSLSFAASATSRLKLMTYVLVANLIDFSYLWRIRHHLPSSASLLPVVWM
jgi:alkanesulfonate monooxygenase SsuD/methylene tetrahydromethanopterin reductase-like flavin-dependent oxidoreductase (luciferase family)